MIARDITTSAAFPASPQDTPPTLIPLRPGRSRLQRQAATAATTDSQAERLLALNTQAAGRAIGLWQDADNATNNDDAAYLRRASLLLAFAPSGSYNDEAELERFAAEALRVAESEDKTYERIGEKNFREWTIAFPERWSNQIYEALKLPGDQDALWKDVGAALNGLNTLADQVPPYLLDHGLPTTAAQARQVVRFKLSLGHANLSRPHIARDYTRVLFRFMGTSAIARFAASWNRIAKGVADDVLAGRRLVGYTEYAEFARNQQAIITGLPERLRTTAWDDSAMKALDRDILKLDDVTFLQGRVASVIGLFGLLDTWQRGSDLFDGRVYDADLTIATGGYTNLYRAATWAYEKGYFGNRGAEIWAAVREHGLKIVTIAALFIGIQFIPYLNIAVDLAVIAYSGLDAVGALVSIVDAVRLVSRAQTVVSLERAAVNLADVLVGDGLRLFLDLLAIAGAVGGIRARVDRILAARAARSEQEAIQQALRESAGREGAIIRRLTAAEEFVARHGDTPLTRLALGAARGNVGNATVVLRFLQGARLSPEDLGVLRQVTPDLYEVALTTEAAARTGVAPLRIIRFLGDAAVPAPIRTLLATAMRRLFDAGLTEAELNAILTRFARAEDLAAVLRALDEAGAGPAATRDVLRSAAAEGRAAADVVAAIRGAAPPVAATAAERVAIFIRSWLGRIRFRTGDQAGSIAEVAVETPRGAARIRISEYDLNHFRTGHTWEDFAFAGENIGRAPSSSLWPPTTTDATILTHARLALNNAAGEIEAAIARGEHGFLRVGRAVPVGGYRYRIGIDLGTGRLTQFFPLEGPGVTAVPRGDLRAAADALRAEGRLP